MSEPICLDDYNTSSELYEDVKRLIWDTCHKFVSRYGGDLDECFADASLLYMRALRAYDPNKGGSFSTILRWHVWGGLLDNLRKQAGRNSRFTRQAEEHIHVAPDRSHFDVMAFKRSLSKDASLVIHLLIATPGDLQLIAKSAGIDATSSLAKKKDPNYRLVKLGITRWLREWGWEYSRIVKSYREIAEAI